MDRRQYLRALPVAGSVLLAGCAGDDPATPTGSADRIEDDASTPGEGTAAEGTPAEEPDGAVETVVLGELYDSEPVSMVVRAVQETDRIGPREPRAGHGFVVVRLAVKNTGSAALAFEPLVQVKLVDGRSRTYERAFDVSTDRPLHGGTLVPGEVLRGDVVFEIPDAASGLQLAFVDGFVGTVGSALPEMRNRPADSGRDEQDGPMEVERDYVFAGATTQDGVHVDLGRSASTVLDLTQDLSVPVHRVGDSVEQEGLTVEPLEAEVRDPPTETAGSEVIVLDLAVTNESGRDRYVPGLLATALKDGEGFSYLVDVEQSRTVDGQFDQGRPIPDGETRRGKLAYRIPEETPPLYFAFEFAAVVDGTKTFWQLR